MKIITRIQPFFTDSVRKQIEEIVSNYIGEKYNDAVLDKIKNEIEELVKFPINLAITNRNDKVIVAVYEKYKEIKPVNLLYSSPIYFISNAIRYSHSNHNKSDSVVSKCKTEYICPNCFAPIETNEQQSCPNCRKYIKPVICCDQYKVGEKDLNLIKKVGFHLNHESVLEHSILIFDVLMSTKALLEESRHRIGVSQTVTSSRYALKVIEILFESTNNPTLDITLLNYKDTITTLLETMDQADYTMDQVAMLLPQSFMYHLQLTFNLRSLKHFLELRLHKSAHITIRRIAVAIMNELKEKAVDYYNLLLEDEKINKSYFANYNEELRNNPTTKVY